VGPGYVLRGDPVRVEPVFQFGCFSLSLTRYLMPSFLIVYVSPAKPVLLVNSLYGIYEMINYSVAQRFKNLRQSGTITLLTVLTTIQQHQNMNKKFGGF
jgi:hypothetical protein